ncbi:hypothetical protein Lfu02_21340 [Longispora fulva]|uniref:Uncharacterized protein n=1 Tax=Longispora fulva TaxID=619741 RepID=A0A8J7GMX4_9ACTN|nr:hypothetical protein [Longispora fulva]MBG6139853.1 hypothetical protein [Longispora fulva]GIG57762.1 hypothetical protein Lfu02_21340 [Longispora fulva]
MNTTAITQLIARAQADLSADRHPQAVLEDVLDALAEIATTPDPDVRTVRQSFGTVEAGSIVIGHISR